MNHLTDLIPAARSGTELAADEIAQAAQALASAETPARDKEIFLTELSRRGETAREIAGFAAAFRDLARDPKLEAWSDSAIDVCGTGGDKSGSYNISTMVMFILAAAGVPVFKHGNRSVTSKCGSADLLEGLGIRIDLDDETIARSLESLGFAFFFAPAFHPAFREIMPVRRALAERGQRSLFNILGPLINPARPAYQLMGVYRKSLVPLISEALHELGLTGGLVVHGAFPDDTGVDELTTVTENHLAGFGVLRNFGGVRDADSFGLKVGNPADLKGGDLSVNLAITESLLAGNAPQTLVDTIVLNAASGLYVVGEAGSIEEGIGQARDLLLGGAVKQKVRDAQDFYRS